MRQQQQRQRMRNRGRKSPNPLSRNYESNGPDVKIRGNASHVAEKYSALARDALSNGDTVMAENYFQHAEHYNRIVAAAQTPQNRDGANANANGRGPQPELDGVPAEVTIKEERNGGGDAEAQAGETAKPRRNGRARSQTPRKAPTESAPDAPEPAKAADGVSEDASKLPSSITGGPAQAAEPGDGAGED